MRITKIRTIAGPNVYHRLPVLVARIDLEELAEVETRAIPGLTERLLALLPGLYEHRCSRGHPGGFVERLNDGTYFAHVTEHVALELSSAANIQVGFGKARWAGAPGVYDIVVRYKSERGMKRVLEIAVELMNALAKGEHYPLEEALEDARALVAAEALGPSTQSIVSAAERRNIPWRRLTEGSLVQLGYGCQMRRIQAALSDGTSHIAVEIAQDKALTKELLRDAGIPVPRGIVARTVEEAREAFRDIGTAVAVKPVDGHQGKAITLNVRDETALTEAFRIAADYDLRGHAIVEEMFEGRDYRALVVNGKLVAAAERRPASVVGDGVSTIAALIERENQNPLRGDGHEKPLTQIRFDAGVERCLGAQRLDAQSVPPHGAVVLLRETANLSTGGTAIDVTDRAHPAVATLCERAARVIGLDICGIDLILPDISEPPRSGGVIEVNAAPGLRMHLLPAEGEPRDVGDAIVAALYPSGNGRIPIVSITGTNGKTSTTRMIAHVMQQAGRCVGMTTSDGIVICGETVMRGDTTGPQSARIVLNDPRVEVAVLETARGGIVRRGLGYDYAEVAVVTNIDADHIGQDGLETIEDVAHVKELVAEQVLPGGTLVLNADDPRVRSFSRHAKDRRLAWFSLRGGERPADGADDAREVFYYSVRQGWIVETDPAHVERRIVPIGAIRATLGGAAEFQVANALAAVAAARACGVAERDIAAALRSFDPVEHNPGRANLYAVNGGYVLLDYGHNAHGLIALGHVLRHWQGYHVTGVIEAPGDRADWVIEEMGRHAAAIFDRILLYDPDDLRGRAPGEVPAILERVIREAGHEDVVALPHDGGTTLKTCIENLSEGEIVVFCYEILTQAIETLELYGAVPVSDVPPRRVEGQWAGSRPREHVAMR